MVNADLVAAKLAELATRVDQVRRHARATADDLAGDRDALDIVSFNLMLAVQICADLASHIVADEGWPVARSLAEGFDRLAERSVIDPSAAAALRRAVRFRNVAASLMADRTLMRPEQLGHTVTSNLNVRRMRRAQSTRGSAAHSSPSRRRSQCRTVMTLGTGYEGAAGRSPDRRAGGTRATGAVVRDSNASWSGAPGLGSEQAGLRLAARLERGTTRARHRERGPRMPWYRTSGYRGGGTRAESRARNSSGVMTRWVRPLRGVFSR